MQSQESSEQAMAVDNKASILLNSIKLKVGSIRRAKQMFSAQLAPDFNIFDYLRSDEMGISRVFADLLNPHGRHGQKKLFLDAFSEKIGEDYQWISSANDWNVGTEKQANGQRRIDIYLSSSSGVIGIENKPWASDQENQISDYAQFLKINSGEKKWLLIYISNRSPSESSVCASDRSDLKMSTNYVELDYNDMIDWLAACVSKVKSLSVRVFIENLIDYIRININKESDMTEEFEVLNEVISSSDNIFAAFHIYRSMQKARQKLLGLFKDDLQHRLAKKGYFLVWDDELIARATRYAGFGVKKKENQDKYLRFEFDFSLFNGLIWGIRRQDEKVNIDDSIRSYISQKMSDKYTGRKVSDWWPWYSTDNGLGDFGFKNWWDSEMPWIAIKEGTLSDMILERADDVYQLFDDKIDIFLPTNNNF
jgi:hypothetical protein